jgi:single-stranded-DNA-specific exonuclease
MQKRWFIKQSPPEALIRELETSLKVTPLMAALLTQRGLTTGDEVRSFFAPEAGQLHDPFLMKNMDKAADRLTTAIKNGETILVYGDYDVDGTTSVALLYSALKDHTAVSFYIPDRYEEGYGDRCARLRHQGSR